MPLNVTSEWMCWTKLCCRGGNWWRPLITFCNSVWSNGVGMPDIGNSNVFILFVNREMNAHLIIGSDYILATWGWTSGFEQDPSCWEGRLIRLFSNIWWAFFSFWCRGKLWNGKCLIRWRGFGWSGVSAEESTEWKEVVGRKETDHEESLLTECF